MSMFGVYILAVIGYALYGALFNGNLDWLFFHIVFATITLCDILDGVNKIKRQGEFK